MKNIEIYIYILNNKSRSMGIKNSIFFIIEINLNK